MKYIFSGLLFLHGSIHLMGFVKAFGLAPIEQLSNSISEFAGVGWLLAFLFFFVAGIALVARTDQWYIFALVAVLLSTALIVNNWGDAKFGSIANVIVLAGALIGYGTSSYYKLYQKEVKSGLSHTITLPEHLLTEADLFNLPEPVAKYIRYTGFVGKPKVHSFKIEFTGKIRKSEQSPWMPFTSEQYNFMDASTRLFFMKAVMKGLPVAGFHCFKNGDAYMDIRLLSLFKVMYQSGKEMGIAETVTFFNDMCCMAPATLIDKRIKWLETKDNRVKATFTNNGITVSAELVFNGKGELVNFISGDRFAAVDNVMQQTPWSTPLKEYRKIDGFTLATGADTIYHYPEGDLCYGTFNLDHIGYNI